MSRTESSTTLSGSERGPGLRGRHGARLLADGSRVYWWRELLGVWIFYQVYSWSRGRATGSASKAWDNAQTIIGWERDLGIYHELRLQELVLHLKPLVVGLNYFYGIAHFLVTIAVFVWLYRRHTNNYPFWRNVFAFLCTIALIGYLTYPLMPPRLLDAYPLNWDLQFHFRDTLDLFPNLWSFKTGPVRHVGNPYAAMPSLHFGWSMFCACVVFTNARRSWVRKVAVAYPFLMLFTIVVTGNHFVLDAVGGALAFGLAYVIAQRVTRAGHVPGMADVKRVL
jgi:hypothetical protein